MARTPHWQFSLPPRRQANCPTFAFTFLTVGLCLSPHFFFFLGFPRIFASRWLNWITEATTSLHTREPNAIPSKIETHREKIRIIPAEICGWIFWLLDALVALLVACWKTKKMSIHAVVYWRSFSVRLCMIKWCDVEKEKWIRRVQPGADGMWQPVAWFCWYRQISRAAYVKCHTHSPTMWRAAMAWRTVNDDETRYFIHVCQKCNKSSNQWWWGEREWEIENRFKTMLGFCDVRLPVCNVRQVKTSRRQKCVSAMIWMRLVSIVLSIAAMTYDYIIFGFVLLAALLLLFEIHQIHNT